MARQHGYKRLTRKARHLIRILRRSRHAGVQDAAIHELTHEINRRWWKRRRPPGRSPATAAGAWRPPTRRAKRLLTQLRRTRVWKVQQRLVGEIARELAKGRRLAERIRKSRAAKAARRVRRWARRTAAPRVAWFGRLIRSGVRRAHEPHLRRAERRAQGRGAPARGPQAPPSRGRLAPGSRAPRSAPAPRDGTRRAPRVRNRRLARIR